MTTGAEGIRAPRPGVGPRSLLLTAALVVVAGVLFAGLFSAIGSDRPDALGWDFRTAYYPAAQDLVHGRSPYPADPASDLLDPRTVYAYPPLLGLVVAPLTALPIDVAAVLAMLVSFAALMGALALVGVRDLRCYAALVIWAPAWNALEMANASALLALLLALVWRYRNAVAPLASALGVLVALKLFVWPLLVWGGATRRGAAVVIGCAIAAALTLGSWAAIGLAGLGEYPELLRRVEAQESYSVKHLALALGLGPPVAWALVVVVGGTLLFLVVRWGRSGDEQRSFLAAVAAALAVSPVVWIHYLVLLAVPLALFRPRFTVLWLLPIVLWMSPRSEAPADPRLALPLLVASTLVVVLGRRPAGAVSPVRPVAPA